MEHAAVDIRRTAVEREATYLELVGLETDAKRRVAQRARVVRDALVDTPALADALRRAGVLDDDDALGALAAGLMAAPLHDPPGDQPLGDRVSAHDVADVLRELYGGRRGEHAGVAGELAARRAQLEKRQRDLLRERDRLSEHERVHDLTLEERRRNEAEDARVARDARANQVAGGASQTTDDDDSDSSSEDVSPNAELAETAARGRRKKRATSPTKELSGQKTQSVTQKNARLAAQDALRPTQVIRPRVIEKEPWQAVGDETNRDEREKDGSPFLLPDVPRESLGHGKRDKLLARLQKELGVRPTQRVTPFVPTKAKDRLLRMKLAHSSVAARLKYLESAASYSAAFAEAGPRETETPNTKAYLAHKTDTRDAVVKTVEEMCLELAVEICGGVLDVLAQRPTREKLENERREWARRAGPRKIAMCRQTLDELVREVSAEEATGVVLEVEANHAAAAGFVAKAIASAVLSRLDGDAACAEFKPWAPVGGALRRKEKESKEKELEAAIAKTEWFWHTKTPAELAKEKALKEKFVLAKEKKAKEKRAAKEAVAAARRARAANRKTTRWSLFITKKTPSSEKVEQKAEVIDFALNLGVGGGESSEEFWSTSSSDESDDESYRAATGRHACQHMLNEMQRRRPPGLVFHHTQPLRPASPPPGIARGGDTTVNFKETKEKNGKAGDGDGESSRESSDGSDESIVSSSSDSDSDSEADIAKKHVLNALHKKELAAAAEAKANAQPPPRSGMADLGVLTEPPPPSQAHRAAFVSEKRYWRATKIAYAFGGKGMARTIEVKRGAVTSLAHAASGRGQVLAAGTSKGELVVWKFAPPGDGSGDTDSEDEKERKQALGTEGTKNTTKSPTKSPNKKLSKIAQKALDAKARTEFYEKAEKKKARERMKLLTPAPVIIARAECTFHPESEMQTEEGGVPSAQYSALTSVSWSADASQLCTAERGGTSRMWSLVGSQQKSVGGTLAIGETLVLAAVNHSTSSPIPDPTPPPVPDGDTVGGEEDGAKKSYEKKITRKTTEELTEELAISKEASMEAWKVRVRQRENWPRDVPTTTRFFPAFTLAGRQPFAMFARPNGDIVRASPASRPAAISDAFGDQPLSGKIQRELAMFRGAKTWARGALFSAVSSRNNRDGFQTANGQGSDSEDERDDEAGYSAEPTVRLDNAGQQFDMATNTKGSQSKKNHHQSQSPGENEQLDMTFVHGSFFVSGVDQLLDAAEGFATGTGGHMGKPERDLLLAPDVTPTLPGVSKQTKKFSQNKTDAKTKTEHGPYTQDVYRGHAVPVVFLDVLPDAGSLVSMDTDGVMCLWAAFSGNAGRSGFGWFSPLGTWRVPREVTAQVPKGFPVEVPTSSGGGRSQKYPGGDDPEDPTPQTHFPWLTHRDGKTRTVVEIPKDDFWIAEDARARLAVESLGAPSLYTTQMELEPVRRKLSIPGVDPDKETAEQKFQNAAGEVGDLDGAVSSGKTAPFRIKSTPCIPENEQRDYLVSQYDEKGTLTKRLKQSHVTRTASAPVVGALIASDGGIPDLVIIRRVSGICASALAVGGVDAALSATPFFTAHTYSLDSMTPTAPRMDLPNPFQPPKGRGALDARRCKAKPGEALTQAGALAALGWSDPAPYPFALAKATPTTGSEHLVVPVGSAHVGVFSIATGLMTRSFDLPGVPEKDGHLSSLKVMDSPHPSAAGPNSATRSLLAVATTVGTKIYVFAIDESAAQIVGVDFARAQILKTPVPTPLIGRGTGHVKDSELVSESDDSDDDEDDDEDPSSEPEPTCVCLANMTTRASLLKPAEAEEMVRDTKTACGDLAVIGDAGSVLFCFAPRPVPGGMSSDPPGVGACFVRFDTSAAAKKAKTFLDGREFANNVVAASFVSVTEFEKKRKQHDAAAALSRNKTYTSGSRARAAEKKKEGTPKEAKKQSIEWPLLRSVEISQYSALFKAADADNSGTLEGDEAGELMMSLAKGTSTTRAVPDEILEQIWELADNDGNGFLTENEFELAMYLVRCAQAGMAIPAKRAEFPFAQFPKFPRR